MNPNLSVMLASRGAYRNVTSSLIDSLDFSNSAPGGFTTASVTLAAPLARTYAELSAYATLTVYDNRSATIVWDGRLEQPGRDSGQGERRILTAVGGATHAKDNSKAVVYADRRSSMWARVSEETLPNGTFGQQDAGGVPARALLYTLPKGTAVPLNGFVVAQYRGLTNTGQHVARVIGNVDFGRATASMTGTMIGRGGPDTDADLKSVASSTTAATMIAARSSDFSGQDHVLCEVRLFWPGAAATIADDITWMSMDGLGIYGTRLDRLGVLVPEATYDAENVGILPDAIIEDVLGRFLPEFDRAGAQIDTSLTDRIEQMAYDDPTTADGILADLMLLNPSHYWAAWENTGAGYRFEWKPWPTVISADLDTRRDAFSSPGGTADLYNEVAVRWLDGRGHSRVTVVTGTAQALTDAGIVRRGFLDLGSQIGSATLATSAGTAFLQSHSSPDNSGTIKVSRPVADLSRGRVLQPWEWRAGGLVRVSNLAPYPDALNRSTSDGVTVFRVSSVAYSARDNTATLALDSYSSTVARALARLAASARTTRRQ